MTHGERRTRRWIVGAAVAGLVLRAAFGLFYWVGKPLTHDEREYLALARSLTEGRGFTYDESEDIGTAQRFGRAPGYPVFLTLIGAGRVDIPAQEREEDGPAAPRQANAAAAGEPRPAIEGVPARVKLAQAVVGALTVWLIGVIACRAGGPQVGIVAASIAAVYPPLVWISAYLFSESLYSAFALLAAHTLQLAFDAGVHRRSRRSHVLTAVSGVLTGAAILIRPAMLFFLPIAVIWLVARRRVLAAALMLAVTLVLLTPWTLRNALVHGRFILVASEGGVTFWTGNHPLARGEGDLAANPQLKQAELEFRQSHAGLTPEELEPEYYRDAFAHIAAKPGRWAGLLLRKVFYTVVPLGPSYTLHSTRYWAASVISYLLLLPLALAGIRWLWQSDRCPTAVLLLGLSAVLAGIVFFPQERFRIPVVDPVLIIAAATAIARLRQHHHTEGQLVRGATL